MRVLAVATVITASACATFSRAPDLSQGRVSVATTILAGPRIMTSTPPGHAFSDERGRISSFATQAWKLWEANGAQSRLDSAAAQVDFEAELNEGMERALNGRLSLTQEATDSDWLIELRVRNYGMDVDNAEAPSRFFLEGELIVTEARSGRGLWRSDLATAFDPGAFFSPGVSVSNVLSAQELHGMGVGAFENQLRDLAALVGGEVATRLGLTTAQ